MSAACNELRKDRRRWFWPRVGLALGALWGLGRLTVPALAQVDVPTLEAAPAQRASGAAMNAPGSQTTRLRCGVQITAEGNCPRLQAVVPVPIPWPEQTVEIVERDVSPSIKKVTFRNFDGAGKLMVIDVPPLRDGDSAQAILTFAVERHESLPPADQSEFVLPPKQLKDKTARAWLKPGPGIPSDSAEIARLANEIIDPQASAWEQVESLHAWVLENIRYQFDEEFRGAQAALAAGHGDCEEMTSLFIALCRARGVPARTVWVPGHCYPEFYLQDAQGAGHWFPAEATSPGQFGKIREFRPVLQKGDDFPSFDQPKERWRYLRGAVKGTPTAGAQGRPQVRIILEPESVAK